MAKPKKHNVELLPDTVNRLFSTPAIPGELQSIKGRVEYVLWDWLNSIEARGVAGPHAPDDNSIIPPRRSMLNEKFNTDDSGAI